MDAPDRLLLHGWQGSGLTHWQTWLARRDRSRTAFPSLPDPDLPGLEPWLAALREALAGCAPRPTVVCHSLGCVLWLHYVATRAPDEPRASRVLLVAPACSCSGVTDLEDFFPVPKAAAAAAADGEAWRVVGSDADPYCPEGAGVAYAEPLGVPLDVIPGAGHLNPDAGFGAWPAVEAWVAGTRPTLT